MILPDETLSHRVWHDKHDWLKTSDMRIRTDLNEIEWLAVIIRFAEFISDPFSIPCCKSAGYKKLQFSEPGSVCNRKISSLEFFVDLKLCKRPLSSSASSKVM